MLEKGRVRPRFFFIDLIYKIYYSFFSYNKNLTAWISTDYNDLFVPLTCRSIAELLYFVNVGSAKGEVRLKLRLLHNWYCEKRWRAVHNSRYKEIIW